MNQSPTTHDAREPDYLWDSAGPPDPEVQRLERILSVYRHRAPAPGLPAPEAIPMPAVSAGVRPGRARLAAAAMILLAGAAALVAHRPQAGWNVTTVAEGAARADRVLPGGWVRTDAHSTAKLEIPGLGQVDLAPETTVRIAAAGKQRRLDLRQGAIHAFITAPPRLFVVDTPAARAVDMGCEYVLEVDSEGAGELRVLLGWVYLQDGGRESRVPMDGGVCRIDPVRGPGTPYFEDAAPGFIAALMRFDAGAGRPGALNAALSGARARDTLSLWHLLWRTTGRERAAVYERIATLKDVGAAARERVLALERGAMEELFEAMRPF